MLRHAIVAAAGLLLAGCAATAPHPTDLPSSAAADTSAFAARLAAHADLTPAERAEARRRAEQAAESWREFEHEARQDFDRVFRHWFYRDNAVPMDHRGWGLPNAIVTLHGAAALDPSFAEAWAALGRLTATAGDPEAALRNLDKALIAARAEEAAGRPLPRETLLRIHRDRAWALRDLARWDEGLAAVDAGLAVRRGDPELVLVKGLLLADSGRYEEAVALAARMPALEYPRYDFIYRGFKQQTSAFANNWIRAQALLARGRVDDAYWKLGDLDLYAYRGLLPFAPRYWRDAALIAELHGDPKAPLYHAVGYITRPYQNYFPVTPLNVDSLVLDVPDPRLPAYLGFGLRTFVAGSPFVYVGTQLNRMVMTGDRTESLEAGGRALRMLDVLQKRNLRPDVCRALRGRVFYAGGDLDTARVELDAARAAFAAAGRTDAGTSLLLGLIAVRDERWTDAETVLAEAVAAEPRSALGWRSLGVALSKQGRLGEAERAMGRAVALEPGAVAGWYNRGLLRLQRKQFARAVADLDRALRLDPENREVQRLLQMAAAGHKAAGGETLTVSSGPPPGYVADPDSLTALVTAQMEATLAPPDSLRGGTPEADRRFRAFEAAYLVDPAPDRRLTLAQAYLDRNLLDSLQALLAPHWDDDLTDAEQLMLLWADRNLGEVARAEEATRRLLAAGPGDGNPWVLAMAAGIMRTSTDPVAAEQNPISPHYNFFFWWKDARLNYGNDVRIFGGMPAYAVDLFRQYRDDPLFEDAVWGLVQTPVTGMNSGVGADGGRPTLKGSVR